MESTSPGPRTWSHAWGPFLNVVWIELALGAGPTRHGGSSFGSKRARRPMRSRPAVLITPSLFPSHACLHQPEQSASHLSHSLHTTETETIKGRSGVCCWSQLPGPNPGRSGHCTLLSLASYHTNTHEALFAPEPQRLAARPEQEPGGRRGGWAAAACSGGYGFGG